MVIRLSPTMKRRIERAAKTQGITPSKFVEEMLKERLKAKRKPRAEEPVSEARRRLRELARYKKPVLDFDAAVHRAKAAARQSYEDNAEFIELAAKRFTQSSEGAAP